ncbi:MAG: hypothetical protein WCK74_06460 [Gemmatimonadaceae bacterium]
MSIPTPDYYQLLYVLPDAPTEVIGAAFRALVGLTKDATDPMALTNLYEAFGVLSDSSRRRQYDAERAHWLAVAEAEAAEAAAMEAAAMEAVAIDALTEAAAGVAAVAGVTVAESDATLSVAPASEPERPVRQTPLGMPAIGSRTPAQGMPAVPPMRHSPLTPSRGMAAIPPLTPSPLTPSRGMPPIYRATPMPPAPCRMCGTVFTPTAIPNARCVRCKAPITPPRRPEGPGHGDGRRSMARVAKSDWAVLTLPGRPERVDVKLRDLSLEGIGLTCAVAFPPGTIARVVWRGFDAVVSILACRSNGTIHDLSARILASAVEAQGGFVQTIR